MENTAQPDTPKKPSLFPKRKLLINGPLAFIAVGLLVVAAIFAVTSISVQNNVNVHPEGAAIKIANMGFSATTLSCTGATYGTGFSIAWTDLTQNGTADTLQICEQNNGGQPDSSPGILTAPSDTNSTQTWSAGSCPNSVGGTPATAMIYQAVNPAPIPAHSATSNTFSFTICAAPTTDTGAYSFGLTVT